jgi:hypothetical protein
MRRVYDANAPKRPVADVVIAPKKRRAHEEDRLDTALGAWNDFDDKYGAFADEHTEL